MAEANRMNIIEKLHKDFCEELTEVNDIILSNLECEEELIAEIGAYLVNSGGKRIRPLLTILSSKLFNYNGTANIKLAAATEFIHAATLLHDDVVDSSMLRRFKPTANSLWGNQSAILVGDYLFSQAFRLMVSADSMGSLRTLSDASATIARGEVTQLAHIKAKKFISKDEYFKIIEAKTSELFASSCKVGAIVSESNEEEANALYEYGKYLGLIFQIQDDILDYFSKSLKIGKNVGDDFYEGKITLPIIELYDLANESDKNLIKNYFITNSNRTEEQLDNIIALMSDYNIKKETDSIIDVLAKKARDSLAQISTKNTEIKTYLDDLIEFASRREC